MKSFRKLALNTGLSLVALLALSACGGGGGTTTSMPLQGTISGVATKGPINNGVVTAYGINAAGQSGTQLATANTDNIGRFSMNIGNYAGPVMLQVSGGSYTDEATGLSMPLATGDIMTALMPTVEAGASSSGIQVTPVTAMAQAMAQHMSGGMTDANITAANTAMGNFFLVGDILHTQPMNPALAGGAGATVDAQNYGMVLAAMSQSAKTLNMTTSSAFVSAMMKDAADGVIDGKMGASQIAMAKGGMMGNSMMAASAGTSGLATAMTDFMNSAANASELTLASMTGLMQKLSLSNGNI